VRRVIYAAFRGTGMADGGEAERMRLNQAAGMVAAQAECTIDEAFVLMRERAATSNAAMAEIIAGVMDRSIRFD
jgi:hypothetical protein